MSTLYDSQNYSQTALPKNLVRFYIGLEEPRFLINDLSQALEKMEQLSLQNL